MDFRKGLPKDPKFLKKYALVEEYMKTATVGDVQFLEVQSYPLVSMTFTSGDTKQDSNERECHLNLIMEEDGFPRSPGGKYETEKHGYSLHCERIKKKRESDSTFKVKAMSFKHYKKYHEGLLMIIDHMIKQHHGVECYLDGDLNNSTPTNVVILHVCDVLNIGKCKRLGLPMPEVMVASTKLQRVPSTIKTSLLDHLIQNTLLTFILNESDHLYTCYAYFGNHSFIPIRLNMTNLQTDMPNASFFMMNEFFVNHQKGKLQEFNRTNTNDVAQEVYKSI
jgi:hypothetical protein